MAFVVMDAVASELGLTRNAYFGRLSLVARENARGGPGGRGAGLALPPHPPPLRAGVGARGGGFFRGARSSRVLVSASRGDELPSGIATEIVNGMWSGA